MLLNLFRKDASCDYFVWDASGEGDSTRKFALQKLVF